MLVSPQADLRSAPDQLPISMLMVCCQVGRQNRFDNIEIEGDVEWQERALLLEILNEFMISCPVYFSQVWTANHSHSWEDVGKSMQCLVFFCLFFFACF